LLRTPFAQREKEDSARAKKLARKQKYTAKCQCQRQYTRANISQVALSQRKGAQPERRASGRHHAQFQHVAPPNSRLRRRPGNFQTGSEQKQKGRVFFTLPLGKNRPEMVAALDAQLAAEQPDSGQRETEKNRCRTLSGTALMEGLLDIEMVTKPPFDELFECDVMTTAYWTCRS
jgi:hypothetical protein